LLVKVIESESLSPVFSLVFSVSGIFSSSFIWFSSALESDLKIHSVDETAWLEYSFQLAPESLMRLTKNFSNSLFENVDVLKFIEPVVDIEIEIRTVKYQLLTKNL